MDAYILSLMVTLDQECAIQQLFIQNHWQFTKINIVDQTVTETLSNVSDKMVGTSEESDQTADDMKHIVALPVYQLNDSRFDDKLNTNDDEHQGSDNVEATSEQSLHASDNTVKEETNSEDKQEVDDVVDCDSDNVVDDVVTDSFESKVTKKRKNNSSAKIAVSKKRKGACVTDKVLTSEIEPSIKLVRDDGSSNNEAEILAEHEEIPDVKHISELLPSDYPDIRSPLKTPTDLDTNCYSASLSVYFCKWCGYTFPEVKYLNGHKQNGQCFFTCQICKEKFTFRNFSKYQDHLKKHRNKNENRPEVSRTTGKCISQLINMPTGNPGNRHRVKEIKNLHVERKFFTCARCPGVKFLTSGTLRCHSIREHGNAFKCHLCGKKFGLSRHLKEHMLSHQSSRDHVCSKCGVAVKYKKSLVRHMQSCDGAPKMKGRPKRERGQLKYPCPECEKQFTTQRLVQQHMYTHGEPDKPCHKCGTSFKHYSALSRHVQNCPF